MQIEKALDVKNKFGLIDDNIEKSKDIDKKTTS